ncbi:solute carrier family 35 member C2 [Drosophila guanche]|uniref:Blast:Solute carrier family 35 member C2 n=1 Tax=Drosophila guanche TaxID=7266 RepID=A0A3B0K1P1_DROGU|nr:solute carrier family 35 member C2 [Drosophila guanche]XP_034136716.1 solute carrier family 35 member C2 [Drosophila guanche]XP_034136717.1 solute carrier family 35 member C2 [Drosophila guanche]SPP87233.1 blast:Solute carrier family 35 member C2 [Drosophila guanche]
MVAAKYERLNSQSGGGGGGCSGGVGSSSGADDDDCEEIELGKKTTSTTTATTTTLQNGKDRRLASNFKYVNSSSSIGSGIGAGGSDVAATSAQEKIMARQSDARIKQMAIGTLVIIMAYLALSIMLTFYQTDINREMPFPLTIVTYHLILKFILAALVRKIYKLRVGRSRVQLDWRVALRKMAPTGVASAIDIGFSNWGLALVPISLYTMTKSSTIVFILLFAIALGLEKKSWSLVSIVGLIGAGLVMFTYKSTQFNALGFFFILFASLSSGLRWSFAQFIMQKSKLGLHNPIDMIYYMQPWMIASLLPLVCGIEGVKLYAVAEHLKVYTTDEITWAIARITFGALLAFLMEFTEFLVLCKTSSLTLSIAGIFKDICQLFLAVTLKKDQLSPINYVGLVVCLAGIACHLWHKYSTMAEAEKQHKELQLDNDHDDLSAEYNFNDGGAAGSGGADNSIAGIHVRSHSTLTVPLLEQTDSEDESGNDLNNKQNSSDVIFDVLKRRDMQR